MNRKKRSNRKASNRKGPLLKLKNISEDTAELYLYGVIDDESFWGDEVTPDMVREKIATMGNVSNLNIYINSPGGSVFAGVAIYNILRRLDINTTAFIDGQCASAATYIAMACNKIIMPINAEFMIHNSMTCMCGNAADMLEVADMLKHTDEIIVNMYAARTGTSKEEIRDLMDKETYMDAEEALAYGFIDEVDNLAPKNTSKKLDAVEYQAFNVDKYKKIMEEMKNGAGYKVENIEETPEVKEEPEPKTDEPAEIPEPIVEPENIDYSMIENNINLTELLIKSLGGSK